MFACHDLPFRWTLGINPSCLICIYAKLPGGWPRLALKAFRCMANTLDRPTAETMWKLKNGELIYLNVFNLHFFYHQAKECQDIIGCWLRLCSKDVLWHNNMFWPTAHWHATNKDKAAFNAVSSFIFKIYNFKWQFIYKSTLTPIVRHGMPYLQRLPRF